MTFKVDDWVVHPRHGVGQIVEIEDLEFDSRPSQPYYQITIPQGTMWVQVNASSNGLRKVATKGDLARCRELLKSRPGEMAEDFHKRQDELSERLLESSLEARCELVRDLSALSWHKSLNEGAAAIARVARRVLCEEWAMAEGVTQREATREVDRLLKQGKSEYME